MFVWVCFPCFPDSCWQKSREGLTGTVQIRSEASCSLREASPSGWESLNCCLVLGILPPASFLTELETNSSSWERKLAVPPLLTPPSTLVSFKVCTGAQSCVLRSLPLLRLHLPQRDPGCFFLHCHSCSSFSFLCLVPRLSLISHGVFVSFVSISKCPAPQGLWDTIHTAIWPTTTTGWEGTRAPTAGSR